MLHLGGTVGLLCFDDQDAAVVISYSAEMVISTLFGRQPPPGEGMEAVVGL